MSILDYLAPRRGPRKSRLTKTLIAKIGFYSSVVSIAVFVLVSVLLDESYIPVEPIPATRNGVEVIDEVQLYLQTKMHTGFLNQDEPTSCWDVFEGKTFKARYLRFGSWQVDVFYELVRYYWRVDDMTLEVTVDEWRERRNLPELDHPTIRC